MLRVTQLVGFAAGRAIASGKVLAASGSYVLVGHDASLRKETASKAITAGGGAYALTGTAASVRPPFTPANLTGLIHWTDMSVSGNITLSGSNITAIADRSGTGTNLINSGTVPYEATGFNGSYPCIHINGATLAILYAPGLLPMGTGNTLTVFYVGTCAEGSTSAGGRVLSYSTGGNDFNSAAHWMVSNSASLTTNCYITRNNLSSGAAGLTTYPAPYRFIFTIDSSGIVTAYVNGVAQTTATSTGNWVSGGNFVIGRQAFLVQDYWAGKIAECGVATGFTSSTDVARLDTYLKNKWGL